MCQTRHAFDREKGNLGGCVRPFDREKGNLWGCVRPVMPLIGKGKPGGVSDPLIEKRKTCVDVSDPLIGKRKTCGDVSDPLIEKGKPGGMC